MTDLYQLTTLEACLREGMEKTAVFEFYVRDLPADRGFLVASGLESLLSFLEDLRFSTQEIAYLAETGRFSRRLLDHLATFRFTGDLYALPEGTVFFPNEPMIRVAAPIPLAQLKRGVGVDQGIVPFADDQIDRPHVQIPVKIRPERAGGTMIGPQDCSRLSTEMTS